MRASRAAQSLMAGLAAALSALGPASAQIVADMPMNLVPPDALAAAQEAAPDAAFYEVSLEVGDEQGHDTLEITGRDRQGRHVEVDLYQENRMWLVEEIERLLPWDETPAAVRAEIAALFGDDWRPTLIERSQRQEDVVVFEIEGVDRYDDPFELEIGEDGGLISLSKFNAR